MSTDFKLRYFKIEKCGYFNGSHKNPQGHDCILQTLYDLKEYVADKSIQETGISNKDQEPTTFILDIEHNDGFWIISLWNKTDKASSDEVVSLDLSSKIGELKSEEVKASKGKTFGFVSYILICPEKRFYATLMPMGASFAGRESFELYIKNFLWINPKIIEKTTKKETSEDGVEFFIEKTNFKLPNKISGTITPHFVCKLLKSQSEIDYVIKNYNKITRIKNNCTVKVTKGGSDGVLKKYLPKLFGNTSLFAPLETIRIKTETSAGFQTKKDLTEWIAGWENAAIDPEQDNCGFTLRGDSKTYWIHGNIITKTITASGLHKVKGIYPAIGILSIMLKSKDLIISEYMTNVG